MSIHPTELTDHDVYILRTGERSGEPSSFFSSFYQSMTEGERVHYRPLAEIEASLVNGYLELEYLDEGRTYYLTIHRDMGQFYLAGSPSGGIPEHIHEYSSLNQLIEQTETDLHAFRWYPTCRPSLKLASNEPLEAHTGALPTVELSAMDTMYEYHKNQPISSLV